MHKEMDRFVNFPPFYTCQPHKPTREKQVELWVMYLKNYCQTNRLYLLPAPDSEPWHNRDIKRTIQPDLYEFVMKRLKEDKMIESDRNGRLMFWWASVDHFVDECKKIALQSSTNIMTAYELFYEEGAALKGMPEAMYTRVLDKMVDLNLVTLLRTDPNKPTELGIKFLF